LPNFDHAWRSTVKTELERRIQASRPRFPEPSAQARARFLEAALSSLQRPRRRPARVFRVFEGRRALLTALVATVLAGALVTGAALAWDIGGLPALFSGEPVPETRLSERDRFALARINGHDPRRPPLEASSVRRLGERDGRAYYSLRRGGEICYASGPAGQQDLFGSIACTPDFPSRDQPILEFTAYHGQVGERMPKLYRFAGLAADGVARVGFVDENRDLHTVPVVDNIYSLGKLPDVGVRSVVAFDHAGRKVYESCVAYGGCNGVDPREQARLDLIEKIRRGGGPFRAQLTRTFGTPSRKVELEKKECWAYENAELPFYVCFYERGGSSVSLGQLPARR
jgi:hypothetical protein